jgi:hypothetical protein
MSRIPVRVYIGPDASVGGTILSVEDQDGYPLTHEGTDGEPRATGYGGTHTPDDWIRWAKRVGAGLGLSWAEIEATATPFGWSQGAGHAPGGIEATSTMRVSWTPFQE